MMNDLMRFTRHSSLLRAMPTLVTGIASILKQASSSQEILRHCGHSSDRGINIGHNIMSRAVLVGLDRAVREMIELLK